MEIKIIIRFVLFGSGGVKETLWIFFPFVFHFVVIAFNTTALLPFAVVAIGDGAFAGDFLEFFFCFLYLFCSSSKLIRFKRKRFTVRN